MDIDKELKDLFDDPLLDVTDKELSIFNLPADMKRVMEGRRIQPEYRAERKKCDDFATYAPLFIQVQQDLKTGRRSLTRANKTADFLQEGSFFVLDGMLVYIASMGEVLRDRGGHNQDARTRCIYENGTESDVLAQTLRRAIYANGYGVKKTEEEIDATFYNQEITEGDKATGFVYVLRSLSSDPEIAGVKDLYKIGFTVNTVEERISNAQNEPTYLMAPVQIVETFQIVNMNSHIFETLVHQVFDDVQFQLKVYDGEGKLHIPSEWYIVPLEIINLVIQKITDGTITHYSYNSQMQCLEKRIVKNSSTFDTKGLRVLNLNIKDKYFQEILHGSKKIEYREIKQTTINKYTYIDEADKKRYLRRYDVICFFVGYNKDRDSALVEVKDITYKDGLIEYHLGRILEHIKHE